MSVKVVCENCHKEGLLKIQLGTTKEVALKKGRCQYCNVVGRLRSKNS